MRTYGLLNVCALIASGIVLAIAYVLLPEKAWTNTTIAAVIIFALSIAFVFFSPSLFRRTRGGSDAPAFAAIAPLSAVSICFIMLSAGALILALAGMDRLAMAADVLAVGAMLVSVLMLKAAMNVVSHASEMSSRPSRHLIWQSDIQRFRAMSSDRKAAQVLEALAEKIRYLASDVPGGTPHDAEIENAIRELEGKLGAPEDGVMESHVREIEVLLDKREIFLRSARSKA